MKKRTNQNSGLYELQLNMEHADHSTKERKETSSEMLKNNKTRRFRGLGFKVNYGFL